MSEYKELPGVNQSRLKEILKHPRKYRDYETDYRTTSYFSFGQLVEDNLLMDEEEFFEKYFISSVDMPSEAIAKIVDEILLVCSQETLEDIPDEVLLPFLSEYQSRWKPETKLASIRKLGDNYYIDRKSAGDKIVISSDDFNKAVIIEDALMSNPDTKRLIKGGEGVEVKYKVPINFVHRSYDCKGEIDIFFIDHNEKICRVVDIKTTSEYNRFSSAILKYRYDFQLSFYYLGAARSGLVPEGYTLKDSMLIVCDSYITENNYYLPAIYKIPTNYSKFTTARGYEYESINEAFNRLDYHTKCDNWDYPMEYLVNGGHYVFEY